MSDADREGEDREPSPPGGKDRGPSPPQGEGGGQGTTPATPAPAERVPVPASAEPVPRPESAEQDLTHSEQVPRHTRQAPAPVLTEQAPPPALAEQASPPALAERVLSRKEVFRLGAARLRLAAEHVGGFAATRVLDRLGPHVQRPPGAQPEVDFLLACTRCNACADACPPNAILQLSHRAGLASGTPFLDPNRYRVCTACEDTPCIAACPTDALLPTAIADVVMGTARVHRDTCIAWQDIGDCNRCVAACPYPDEAILSDEDGRVYVDPRHCIGCGRCVAACPTDPRSIRVDPAPRG